MVMFEADRSGLDRAYVANPVDLEDGVITALQWCLSRTGGDWSKVGMRVPAQQTVSESPVLQSLQKRGVKVSGETHRGRNELAHGPLIVYMPTLQSLCQAEEVAPATALVVVGAYGAPKPEDRWMRPGGVGLQPWVSAFHPEHLAGEVIEPSTPIISDAVVWQAMKTFTDTVNSSTGLADSRDRSRVIDGLTKLRRSGHTFVPIDLLAAALRLNWRGTAAWDLKMLAQEINSGKQKRVRETYRSDIVQIWERTAEKPDG